MAASRRPEKITDTIAKDKERSAFSIRLRDAMKKIGLQVSPTQLAAEFNARFTGRRVGMHTCRKWIIGETIPTQEKLMVLAAMFGVSPDWLRFGDTASCRRGQYFVSEPITKYNRHELALINDYKQLHPRDQTLVRALVGAMIKT